MRYVRLRKDDYELKATVTEFGNVNTSIVLTKVTGQNPHPKTPAITIYPEHREFYADFELNRYSKNEIEPVIEFLEEGKKIAEEILQLY